MIAYLVESWNPWDCSVVHKKVFISKDRLYDYLSGYKLDKSKDEELTVSEVEIGD